MMENTENKKTNFLAQLFINAREIVETAETPFAKLAVFILPILAPSVPAFMTGLHMYKLLDGLFSEEFGNTIYVLIAILIISIIISITLELLGYVGAITFIKSLFIFVKKKSNEYLLPFILNGLAYLFYLVAMWMINFLLGSYFGTPKIINSIFGLLSFITVPTGLLAANHLNTESEREEDEKLRKEQMDYKLKAKALKHGINVFEQQPARVFNSEEESLQTVQKKKGDWRLLSNDEKHLVKNVLSVEEIMHKHGVGRSTAFGWKNK